MSLTIANRHIEASTTEGLSRYKERGSSYRRSPDVEVAIDTNRLPDDSLAEVAALAEADNDNKLLRAIGAIIDARRGDTSKPVPNFKAFESMLRAYLQTELLDGWLYSRGRDGKLYPELVVDIKFKERDERHRTDPEVIVSTIAYGLVKERGNGGLGTIRSSHTFSPGDVARRRMHQILEARDLFKETPALRAEYAATMARYNAVVREEFAEQFRVEGFAYHSPASGSYKAPVELNHRKVIHDLEGKDFPAVPHSMDSVLFDSDAEASGVAAVPEHPVIRVFDVKSHAFHWVHSDLMKPYQYNKGLRDKLVLPQTHRDLLDVLTTDLDLFIGDIIEGKSAGNIVLCKGPAGVGKTLTAEVYSELIERPVYSVHSGTLGVTAKAVQASLEEIFERALRWNCVLLLDEADVFVSARRPGDVQQNAIVAEFLRVLEYFEGLMFMTTNRPDDIDDAILSRCAAIIGYAPPPPPDAKAIWRVLADQFGAELPDKMIEELVVLFPELAPRDMKMLLRLVMRMANHKEKAISVEAFRQAAMFRAVRMSTDAVEA